MRFPTPNTLWDFREALIAAKALDRLFERLDRAIQVVGYLPMGDRSLTHIGGGAETTEHRSREGRHQGRRNPRSIMPIAAITASFRKWPVGSGHNMGASSSR
jgi:hypothetical protein